MQPQPYAPQPPAKSNKKLWIVLGLLIGLPAVAMAGCVACVALLGLAGAGGQQNSSAPTTSAPSVSTTTPASHANTTAANAGVTMANYNRLRTGMTYPQVVAILGKEGTELSSNEIAGTRTIMYQWEGESFASNMNAMFQNGKLIQKAQFGLK